MIHSDTVSDARMVPSLKLPTSPNDLDSVKTSWNNLLENM